ncbi:M28 family peptidase [Turicibacter sp. 1E2]|uniref:M28 family peptidase n=1 Tax=Turicibacter sp. 1E2 TaxID=2951143 RepID=UPI0021D5082C|nr:M28 family peptidase [Turicibacter sp. 1E2]MCU7209516.1 M28 family peptidase [Turicibacter sp. 1E2]
MTYQEELNHFYDAINVDYATYVAGTLSQSGSNETLGFRTAGSPSEKSSGQFLYHQFQKIGLSDVRKEEITIDSWEFKTSTLHYLDRKKRLHQLTLCAYATHCIEENLTLDLVYVGKGTKNEYKNIDVRNKLVLVDLDTYIGCQIGICALQARQKGAYGIIAAPMRDDQQLPADALTYENFNAPVDIPAFAVSLQDACMLKKQLSSSKNQTLPVVLNCYSHILKDQPSYNIIGEIPGKNQHERILIMSHYDGLFYNFHSGACGCGLLLGLARALIKSHYVPDKTLVFIAHGAKEWGLSESSFNWSIGGYQQITKNHPEWAKEAMVAINLEGFVAYDDFQSHHIKTTEGYQDFIRSISKLVPGCPYPDGCVIDAPTTIVSDDFSYSQSGIPTIISYRPTHEQDFILRQTSYDEITHHFSYPAFEYCHKLYGTFIILFDQMKIMPLKFEKFFEAFEESLDFQSYHSHKELYFLLQTAKHLARHLYTFTQFAPLSPRKSHLMNIQLHELYLKIQQSFVRLTWDGTTIFPHEAYQKNMVHLKEALRLLKQEKLKSAVEQLCRVDLNLYAFYYDQDTYEYFLKQSTSQDDKHMTWGKNLIVSQINLYELIDSLLHKHANDDLCHEISQLKSLLAYEKIQEDQVMVEEIRNLKQIIRKMRRLLTL